jgi:hypothetical protein
MLTGSSVSACTNTHILHKCKTNMLFNNIKKHGMALACAPLPNHQGLRVLILNRCYFVALIVSKKFKLHGHYRGRCVSSSPSFELTDICVILDNYCAHVCAQACVHQYPRAHANADMHADVPERRLGRRLRHASWRPLPRASCAPPRL